MNVYRKNLHGYRGFYRQPVESNILFQQHANWLFWRKRPPRSASPVTPDVLGEEVPGSNTQYLVLTSRRGPNPISGV